MIRYGFLLLYTVFAIAIFPQNISSSIINENVHYIGKKEIQAKILNAKKVISQRNIVNNMKIEVPRENEAYIKLILKSFPKKYFKSLKTIKSKPESNRRGLASNKSIYINFDKIDSKKELRRVFIHELGHVFDLGYLTSKEKKTRSNFKDGSQDIYLDDKSVLFYSLCWENEDKQNGRCSDKDFVSGYAHYDPFEDFAESFLLYFENNESFRIMANESEILKAKYNLLNEFLNKMPTTGVYKGQVAMERPWDLTVMR